MGSKYLNNYCMIDVLLLEIKQFPLKSESIMCYFSQWLLAIILPSGSFEIIRLFSGRS